MYAVFGLQGDHLAMLLLTLMTVEMHVMQFVNWMVCSEELLKFCKMLYIYLPDLQSNLVLLSANVLLFLPLFRLIC